MKGWFPQIITPFTTPTATAGLPLMSLILHQPLLPLPIPWYLMQVRADALLELGSIFAAAKSIKEGLTGPLTPPSAPPTTSLRLREQLYRT